MKKINFNHQIVPAIGLGTWRMGEGNSEQIQNEIQTIQYGLDNGLKIIDTAEMYGEGLSETMIGKAIKGYKRDDFQIISKFYPYHATFDLIEKSVKKSLTRLQTDYLDYYLLHWRGDTPLKETIEGLQNIKKAGYIREWGVSNFDLDDLKELFSLTNGNECKINEDLYNINSRSIEYSILPWQEQHDVAFIGYSPFGSDGGEHLVIKPILKEMAAQKHISVYQLLLAWAIRNKNILSIPKTSSLSHLKDNIKACDVEFSNDELELLDKSYPKPTASEPLETI